MGISVQSEIRGDCLFIFLPLYNLFNLLALRVLPLYSLTETQGERDMHHSVPVIESIIPSLLAMSRSITGDSALAIKEYVRKGKGAAMYL